MRRRLLITVVALAGATRCGGGSTSPSAPGGSTTTPAAQHMVSADLPAMPIPQTAGLFQDGVGAYPPGDAYTSPSGSDVFVQAHCTSPTGARELNLVLPQNTRGAISGRLSKCASASAVQEQIYLHLSTMLNKATGDVIGPAGAPPNADTSSSIFLYLNVDSNGDGTIQVPPDDSYNIRWQKGIYLKQRSETPTTTVYELTTLATQFGPDVSCSAELILRNTPLGEISKGFYCIPLVLTVTAQK